MIHANSRAAYLALQEAGEIQPKEMLVLEALEQFGPMTRQELECVTGMRLSCVCGRVRGLLDKFAIEEEGSKYNPATRKNNAILQLKVEAVKRADEQMSLLEAA